MTAHMISFSFFLFFNGHTCSPFTLWNQFVNVQLHINIYIFEDKIVKRAVSESRFGLHRKRKGKRRLLTRKGKDDC